MPISKDDLGVLVAMAMIVGIYLHCGDIEVRTADEYCAFLLNELDVWNNQHPRESMPPEYIETRLIQEFGL